MRILLVEDDLLIGRSLLHALKDAGYSVDWVRDGPAGHDAMAAASYTAVLLDLGLPGMGGIELLKSARGVGKQRAHPDPDRARRPRHARPGARYRRR